MRNRMYIVASVFSERGQSKENKDGNFYFNGDILSSQQDSDSRSAIIDEGEGIFAVCDGMGGDGFGQKASKEVVERLADHVKTIDKFGSVEHYINRLNMFISEINDKIFKMAVHYPDLKGMGTTFASLIIKNRKAVVLNIGDTRVYHFRNGTFRQLSIDHTEAERMFRLGIITKDEAKRHIKRHIVSRYIGLSPLEGRVEGEACEVIDTENGDYFLICSNSLNEFVDERKISELINSNNAVEDLGRNLLNEVTNNGGMDNVTFIIVKIQAENEALSVAEKDESNKGVIGKVAEKYNLKKVGVISAACLGLIAMSYVLTFLFGKIGTYMKYSSNNTVNMMPQNTPTSMANIKEDEKVFRERTAQNSYISPVATPFISSGVSVIESVPPTNFPAQTPTPQVTKQPGKTTRSVTPAPIKTNAPRAVSTSLATPSKTPEGATGEKGSTTNTAEGGDNNTAVSTPTNSVTTSTPPKPIETTSHPTTQTNPGAEAGTAIAGAGASIKTSPSAQNTNQN